MKTLCSIINPVLPVRRVLILAFFCLLMLTSAQEKEPYYQGRSLSDWLCYNSGEDNSVAFKQMGTNAIPTLMDIIAATPKTIKSLAGSRLDSKRIREHLADYDDTTFFLQLKESAAEAFETLETNAEPAIPKMLELLNKDEAYVSIFAAAALVQIGPKGFTVLTNALTARNASIRQDVVIALGTYGQGTQSVGRILLNSLKDPSPEVRQSAGDGLAKQNSEDGIPALILMLDDQDPAVRRWVASDLGFYGAKAKSAAPKILSLYTNRMEKAYFDALEAIDLETAEKAETFTLKSGPLNPYRVSFTKTRLKSGLELIAGGCVCTKFPAVTNRYLASAEIYNPKTEKWTETGEMTTPRYGHAAVLLSSGKVLVVAGESGNNNGTLSSAETYDPAAEKWIPTTSMLRTHPGCKAKLNPDGTVLVYTEIYNNVPPPDWITEKCEQYDPATEKWTVIPNQVRSK